VSIDSSPAFMSLRHILGKIETEKAMTD
jgi:hypothetical protein